MSHPQQQDFVRYIQRTMPQYFLFRRVLEVGSLNVNGTVREFFYECKYTGLDLGPGPGVDFVCHAADWTIYHSPYEVIISCEALEHDKKWRETLKRCQELLLPGGLLIVTCAGHGRPAHGTKDSEPECSPYTLDYYGNLGRADIEPLLGWPAHWHHSPQDTRFFMIKGLER